MEHSQDIHYDYIIAGSGCAGLSLLYRILKDPNLNSKSILVIDKSEKITNDRTWCYWESENGFFDSIVTHEWKTLEFLTNEFTRRFDLKHYRYKMIKGIAFYNLVLSFAKDFKNVTYKFEHIKKIQTEKNYAFVETENAKYLSQYVFNSTNLFYPKVTRQNALLQHFEGKEIFSIMFQKLNPEKILSFLGNESNFLDEIRIMNSLPKITFFIAGIKRLW